jgi:hypothetical protein
VLSSGSRALCDRFDSGELWQIADVDQSLSAVLAIDKRLDTRSLDPSGQHMGSESGCPPYVAESNQVIGVHGYPSGLGTERVRSLRQV